MYRRVRAVRQIRLIPACRTLPVTALLEMMPTKTRLHRSELCVPGSNVRMLEKAPALGADVVMLDLEDAVAPDDKEQARINVDRRAARAGLVALLGLGAHQRPRHALVLPGHRRRGRAGGRALDAIVIPKVSGAGDVHLVATLLTQIEEAMGFERRIGLAVLIETAIGMVNVDEIARACPERMEAMIFGVADYAASIQSHTASIGGVDPSYSVLTDPAGRPMSASATGATSGTTRSRASPSPAARTGCVRSTARSATSPTGGLPRRRAPLGGARLRGQVGDPPLAGRAGQRGVHAGAAARGAHAPDRRGDAEAAAEGKGAVSLDGRLIDAASIRMAENLLRKLEQIEAREAGLATRSAACPAQRSARVSSAATKRCLPSTYASRTCGWRSARRRLMRLRSRRRLLRVRAQSSRTATWRRACSLPASQTCRW